MTRNCRSANKAESFGSRLGGSGYVLKRWVGERGEGREARLQETIRACSEDCLGGCGSCLVCNRVAMSCVCNRIATAWMEPAMGQGRDLGYDIADSARCGRGCGHPREEGHPRSAKGVALPGIAALFLSGRLSPRLICGPFRFACVSAGASMLAQAQRAKRC